MELFILLQLLQCTFGSYRYCFLYSPAALFYSWKLDIKSSFRVLQGLFSSYYWLTAHYLGNNIVSHNESLLCSSCTLCQRKGLQDEGPADGAVLEVRHTAVTHTGMSAGQQHSVHCCILTDHTVSAPPL